MTKQTKQRERETTNWFCKKHGLRGTVGKDWCFGCYRLDEDTEQPVPHIGYGIVEPEYKQQIRRAIELLSDIHDAHNQALSQQREDVRREVVEEIRDWVEQNRDERPDKLFNTDSKGGNYELGRRDENIVLINELVKILDKLVLSAGEEKGTK